MMSNDPNMQRPRVDSDGKLASNGGLEAPSATDIMNSQYMNVHKVPELSKGLTDSLTGGLLDHGVVDLEASDFSQQSMVGSQYYDDDILSQGLTDDDRRLAAALVAVQLSKSNNQSNPSADQQQQSHQQPPPQQQQQQSMLPNDLLNPKPLPSMQSIDKPAMSTLVPNYMQSVEDAVVQEQLNMLERSNNDLSLKSMFPPQVQNPSNTEAPSNSYAFLSHAQTIPSLLHMSPTYVLRKRQKYTSEHLNNDLSEPKQSSGVKSEVKEEYLAQAESQNSRISSNRNVEMKLDPDDGTLMSCDDMGNDANDSANNTSSNNEDGNDNDGDGGDDEPIQLSDDQNDGIQDDDFDSDYDGEKPSRKSLPHKKRIPKKLKRGTTLAPTRNPHAKGASTHKKKDNSSPAAAPGKKGKKAVIDDKNALSCELCSKTFTHQLKFFEHLKAHYEPLITISTPGSSGGKHNDTVSSTSSVDDHQSLNQSDFNVDLSSSEQGKSESSSGLSCNICGKTFRRPKALDTHMAMSHAKHDEMEDFSEPEDMMEGIRDVVGMVQEIDEKPSSAKETSSSTKDASWVPPKRKRGRPRKSDVTRNQEENAAEDVDEWAPPPPKKKRGRPKKSSYTSNELARNSWLGDSDAAPTMVDSTDNGFDMDLMSPFGGDKKKIKKTLACTLCPRTFNHRNSLMYHVRSHSGQRPHQCEVCGKSFFAASALKVHLRLHSGAKPYKCEYCERHFRQWGDLKYHITSIHTDQKQFQCEYCGKDFARKYSLIVHRRIHTGEKNYICEFCHKSFRASSYLQNHRRIHTGEKPHQCQICGKPFRVRSDMKRHTATHNKVMVTSSQLQNNDVSQRLGIMPTTHSVNDHHSVNRVQDGSITLTKVDNVNHHTNNDYKGMKNSQLLVRFEEEQDSALPDGSSCSAPLNLNIRPHSDSDDGLAYSRESLERESSTLYVWIPAGADHLLPDE